MWLCCILGGFRRRAAGKAGAEPAEVEHFERDECFG